MPHTSSSSFLTLLLLSCVLFCACRSVQSDTRIGNRGGSFYSSPSYFFKIERIADSVMSRLQVQVFSQGGEWRRYYTVEIRDAADEVIAKGYADSSGFAAPLSPGSYIVHACEGFRRNCFDVPLVVRRQELVTLQIRLSLSGLE